MGGLPVTPRPFFWVPNAVEWPINLRLRVQLEGSSVVELDCNSLRDGGNLKDLAQLMAGISAKLASAGFSNLVSLNQGFLQIWFSALTRFEPTPFGAALGMTAASGGPGPYQLAHRGVEAMPGLWMPMETPRYDSGELIESVAGFQKSLLGHHRHVEHGVRVSRRVIFEWIPEGLALYGPAGFGRRWRGAMSQIHWWDSLSIFGVPTGQPKHYFLEEPREQWNPERMFTRPGLYRLEFLFGKYELH